MDESLRQQFKDYLEAHANGGWSISEDPPGDRPADEAGLNITLKLPYDDLGSMTLDRNNEGFYGQVELDLRVFEDDSTAAISIIAFDAIPAVGAGSDVDLIAGFNEEELTRFHNHVGKLLIMLKTVNRMKARNEIRDASTKKG
jgi:hypothetical protein